MSQQFTSVGHRQDISIMFPVVETQSEDVASSKVVLSLLMFADNV